MVLPIAVAASSPLLAWRDTIYIAAGFAGILAMALLLVQPLLVGGYLPGLTGPTGRRVHRWIGVLLVTAVAVHVAGLWLTSPPDVIDALTFTSPTPFSDWGVIAMWALFAAALMAALRGSLKIRPKLWRLGHTALVVVVVLASVIHAMLIEGTMGTVSKALLCLLSVVALVKVIADLRIWTIFPRSRI
ncbi:MAG: ferric reductase-like transmembrane domain-containing protein [Pseudomonadota bacterium]